jgi:hypothetical protein
MANVTAYDNGDPIIRAAGSSNAGVPDFVIIRNTIDAGKATIAEDDTFDILEIPANTVVLSVFLKVISAEATVTVALGVTGDDARRLHGGSVACGHWCIPGYRRVPRQLGCIRAAALLRRRHDAYRPC